MLALLEAEEPLSQIHLLLQSPPHATDLPLFCTHHGCPNEQLLRHKL